MRNAECGLEFLNPHSTIRNPALTHSYRIVVLTSCHENLPLDQQSTLLWESDEDVLSLDKLFFTRAQKFERLNNLAGDS